MLGPVSRNVRRWPQNGEGGEGVEIEVDNY